MLPGYIIQENSRGKMSTTLIRSKRIIGETLVSRVFVIFTRSLGQDEVYS